MVILVQNVKNASATRFSVVFIHLYVYFLCVTTNTLGGKGWLGQSKICSKDNSKCLDSLAGSCQTPGYDVFLLGVSCPVCVLIWWRALGVRVTLLFFPLPSFKDWPSLSSRSGSYSPHSWKVQVYTVHACLSSHSHCSSSCILSCASWCSVTEWTFWSLDLLLQALRGVQ